jgi:hypothetical protein
MFLLELKKRYSEYRFAQPTRDNLLLRYQLRLCEMFDRSCRTPKRKPLTKTIFVGGWLNVNLTALNIGLTASATVNYHIYYKLLRIILQYTTEVFTGQSHLKCSKSAP